MGMGLVTKDAQKCRRMSYIRPKCGGKTLHYAHEDVDRLLVQTFNEILKVEESAVRISTKDFISANEIHTMEAIGTNTHKSMSEVAAALHITVSTLTTSINRLVLKGMVVRSRSEEDRRVVCLSLTDKARIIVRAHQRFHREMVKAAVDGLSDQEVEILKHTLGNIRQFFSDRL